MQTNREPSFTLFRGTHPPRIWIFLFFFISGATGLIYEVVWTRLLTLVMGNTHYSISTVLTAFMGGLALGSYAGGKLIDRKFNPLNAYAFLEGGIGLYCLMIPSLIDLTFPVFKWIYLNFGDSYTQASMARFLICVSILILPATFMGATLPVLSKYISKNQALIGKDVGTLYSINTFGAVFGAWASAFIFMRLWGVQSTIWMAALLNLAIAGAVFLIFRPPLKDKGHDLPAHEFFTLDKREKSILLSFGVSGMVALIYQVAWNRILSLLLGSSVYAFSLILTVFILGLAFGTVSFSRLLNKFSDFMKVYGVTQLVIGLYSLAIIPLFGQIPFANRWIYENWGLQFEFVQLANFLIIFSLIFIPTFFMGAQFPLVIKLTARKLETLGHHVGRAYAFNTVGAIVGSFVAGFILIPE